MDCVVIVDASDGEAPEYDLRSVEVENGAGEGVADFDQTTTRAEAFQSYREKGGSRPVPSRHPHRNNPLDP